MSTLRLNDDLIDIIGVYAHKKFTRLPDGTLEITDIPMKAYTIHFKRGTNEIEYIEPCITT